MSTPAAAATAIPKVGSTKTFTVPESVRQPGDPQKMTLRTSFAIQVELDALKATGQDGNLNYQILQRIIVKTDGKPVDQGKDFMENWSPQVRVLAVDALNSISMPKPEVRKDFLDSGVIED